MFFFLPKTQSGYIFTLATRLKRCSNKIASYIRKSEFPKEARALQNENKNNNNFHSFAKIKKTKQDIDLKVSEKILIYFIDS